MSRDELSSLARAAAGSLRLGMTAQGSEALAALVERLLPYLAQHPDATLASSTILNDLVAAQARGDVLGVADGLEHELLPILLAH